VSLDSQSMMASLTSLSASARKCAELVRTKDAGTLPYELYFNSDHTECLVFERYRDSQALLDYHKNIGDNMAAMLQTCSASVEICGTSVGFVRLSARKESSRCPKQNL
jgi:quinol monooxygenase YgiN